MNRHRSIRIVTPALFNAGTAQTSGSQRRAAITARRGIESTMWAGLFTVEPGAKTGIHHHGQQETIAYVLDGHCRVRWGEHGEFSATARAGDFLYVPPQLPHMEINLSQEQSFTWVVVRSTAEPIVVNLPDEYWDQPHGAHVPSRRPVLMTASNAEERTAQEGSRRRLS